MTAHPESSTSTSGPFDAAKAIVEALTRLDRPTQALALKFAAETLGLQTTPTTSQESKSAQASDASDPPSGGGPTHSTDMKQFTAAKAPKTDQQFAAVVAYFYRFEAPPDQRRETIGADTLVEAARLAGRRRPAKAYFTLNNAKNAGYLDSAGTGQFQINSVGENLVAMALPGDDDDSAPRTPRKKADKKKAKESGRGAKTKRKKRG